MGPDRIWGKAIDKCRDEGACRVCGLRANLEAAHLAPRKHDKPKRLGAKTRFVAPDNVIPMCSRDHYLFDAGRLDVLQYLTVEEQVHVVKTLGGIDMARRRLAPLDYKETAAA
jgi:hypothetical protein